MALLQPPAHLGPENRKEAEPEDRSRLELHLQKANGQDVPGMVRLVSSLSGEIHSNIPFFFGTSQV